MFTYETYAVKGGYGYRILADGKPFIDQPFLPCVAGAIIMTRAKAISLATKLVNRMNDIPTEEERAALDALATKSLNNEMLTEEETVTLDILSKKGSCVLTLADVEG